MANPQQSLQKFLLAPIPHGAGLTIEQAKRMVMEWKELGVDLSNGNTIHQLVANNEILLTMASLSNFGITSKITHITKTLGKTNGF